MLVLWWRYVNITDDTKTSDTNFCCYYVAFWTIFLCLYKFKLNVCKRGLNKSRVCIVITPPVGSLASCEHCALRTLLISGPLMGFSSFNCLCSPTISNITQHSTEYWPYLSLHLHSASWASKHWFQVRNVNTQIYIIHSLSTSLYQFIIHTLPKVWCDSRRRSYLL